jgi:hypothetical protein
MVRDGYEWFGGTCTLNIRVAQTYNILAPTGTSSASTYVQGSPYPWDFSVEIRNSGAGDSRNGPSAASNGVVDGFFRYTVNGVVTSGIPTPTPAISNVTIAGGSRINRSYTVVIPTTLSVNLGDQICVQGRAKDINGFEGGPITNTGYTGWNNLACIDVAEQAYLTVLDNGVWAGGGFDTSSTGFGTPWCDVPGGAAEGFIQTAQLGSIGAYADYVVGATGAIANFGSTAVTANTMTFANTVSPNGQYNAQGRCITDFTTYLRTNTAAGSGVSAHSVNNIPSANGQYYHNGNLTLSTPTTIPRNRRITMIVNGDVTISRNIVYQNNYQASNKSEIPVLLIIATGNINITDAVTDLAGFYFAKGDINTCSNRTGNLSSTICDNQLTVRGVFAANDIEFRRTHGGISGANGPREPAEVFDFSPEFYLAEPYLISDHEPKLGIDAIKDLPPVIN